MTGAGTRSDQNGNHAADGKPSEKRQTPRARTTAEWTTLIGSLAVVLALVGAALYEHFGQDEPSGTWLEVEVAPERAVQRGDEFYVPFVVMNRGSKPAEDVAVIFEVMDGETLVEESTIQVPFLPNSGSAEGELVTTHDPATHTIEARPAAILTP